MGQGTRRSAESKEGPEPQRSKGRDGGTNIQKRGEKETLRDTEAGVGVEREAIPTSRRTCRGRRRAGNSADLGRPQPLTHPLPSYRHSLLPPQPQPQPLAPPQPPRLRSTTRGPVQPRGRGLTGSGAVRLVLAPPQLSALPPGLSET